MLKKLSYVLFLLSLTFYGQTIPIDVTFNQGNIGPNGIVNDYIGLPNGKIIIIGNFSHYNGVPRQCIARINSDGTLDDSFNPGIGASIYDGSPPFLSAVELTSDGKILIGGNFEMYNDVENKILVRLNSDGTYDPTFSTGGIFNSFDPMDNGIHDIEVTDSGKIFVCGSIGLVKLNADGSHDNSFDNQATGSILGYVTKVKELENGKLIVGGWNLLGSGFGRLNPDGSVDESFVTPDYVSGFINDFYIDNNGKILIGGLFLDEAYFFLVQINEDGSEDESFEIHYSEEVEGQPNSGVYCIRKHLNKILVSGLFDSFGNSSINDIALINNDGSIDESFDTGDWPSRYIRSVFVQNQTNILVSPRYQNWQEPTVVPSLLRLGDGMMETNNFLKSNEVSIYSNETEINIIANSESIKSVWVYDINGKMINYAENIDSNKYSFFPYIRGVYVGIVKMSSGKVLKLKTIF